MTKDVACPIEVLYEASIVCDDSHTCIHTHQDTKSTTSAYSDSAFKLYSVH